MSSTSSYMFGNNISILHPEHFCIAIVFTTVGEGCSFITANCDSWSYSCPPLPHTGCSYDYQAEVPSCMIRITYYYNFLQSVCVDSYYHDGCHYFTPYFNGFCNSPEGTCVMALAVKYWLSTS